MKKQLIKNLKVGDKVETFVVAKHKHLEYFRASKGQFLTIVLADRSGRILARVWDKALEYSKQFEEEDLIAVWGRVDEYMGRPQIIVTKLRAARPTDKDTYYSEDDFVPQTSKDIEALWADVTTAVEGMTTPFLKTLVQAVMAGDLSAGLRAAPATKAMHHSYRGGLMEHIVEMLTLSRCLLTLYPTIDRDLLTAGIILHDVGSVEGARYERDIDYSDAGRLAGHVVLGDRLVAGLVAAVPEFPADLALRLSHMILSHHGEVERGAVREPQTLEAMALYLLNKLSAELNHVQQVFDAQWDASKPWTEFDRLLDRSYFRGRSLEPEPPPEAPVEPSQPAAAATGEPVGDGPIVAEQRPAYGEPA